MNKKETYKPSVENREEKNFLKDIEENIKDNNHKDFFVNILKEFEDYKKFMSDALVDAELKIDTIFRVRFTYMLKQNVWREFELFENQNLTELAESLIESMDWDYDHLHSYWFPIKEKYQL